MANEGRQKHLSCWKAQTQAGVMTIIAGKGPATDMREVETSAAGPNAEPEEIARYVPKMTGSLQQRTKIKCVFIETSSLWSCDNAPQHLTARPLQGRARQRKEKLRDFAVPRGRKTGWRSGGTEI